MPPCDHPQWEPRAGHHRVPYCTECGAELTDEEAISRPQRPSRVVVTFRLDPEPVKQLRALAGETRVTQAEHFRRALTQYLERQAEKMMGDA